MLIYFVAGVGTIGVISYFTYRDIVWDMAVKALVAKTK